MTILFFCLRRSGRETFPDELWALGSTGLQGFGAFEVLGFVFFFFFEFWVEFVLCFGCLEF